MKMTITKTNLALLTMVLGLVAATGLAGTAVHAATGKSKPGKTKPSKPAKAICAVCNVHEGGKAKPEEVKATLNYKGKTYSFCDLSEKAEFISNPSKYAK